MNIATLAGEKGLLLLPVNANVVLNIHLSAALNEKFKSVYIGKQPKSALLFQTPAKVKHAALLQAGHIATVRAVSMEGEGAILAFNTTILRFYSPPFAMIATTIPDEVQLKLIRNEPRFKLEMTAEVTRQAYKVQGWLEDISCNGCCFCCPQLPQELKSDRITILLKESETSQQYQLFGMVKNYRHVKNCDYIGISFEDDSKEMIQQLLQSIILKGSRDF
ncbi:PilZ domain-containing protein [Thalassomonas sp. RHCl1]|uniref:PilZ domain-containing protein n=1 Tax=Thalassomonas sp. RHCl1 TaxID=2995320 RepID=UPI00248CCD03|nr:PilZ domain-containing protein [Thalassomonas sp. RHCl1]